MNKSDGKVKLSNKQILGHYFHSYRPCSYVEEVKYYQISADQSLSEIDAVEVVNDYWFYLNMFLGANCTNSDKLDFEAVKRLFLTGKKYSKANLSDLAIGFDFDDVSSTNLSGNDFSKYNFVWDFGNFLSEVYQGVHDYVYPSFVRELKKARECDEEEFYNYGVLGDSCVYVTRKMNSVIHKIIKKLIPNVQNTNLKIKLDMDHLYTFNGRYELVEEILKNGNLDGCYVKVLHCDSEFVERLGLTKSNDKLYYYPSKKFTKKMI